MHFQKPEAKIDFLGAVIASAKALGKLQAADASGAAEELSGAWEGSKGELQNAPQHLAWTFLANCVVTAMAITLRTPRLHCKYGDGVIEEIAKKMADKLPEAGTLRGGDLTNLALSELTNGCIEHAVAVVRSVSTEVLDEDEVRRIYQDALRRSVTVVFDRQSSVFGPLIASLTGLTAEPDSREFAWKRHDAWVRSLFHEAPVFSPEGDVDVPLSDVYLRLRCFWNEEHQVSQEGFREDQVYRTATVADLHQTIGSWLETSTDDDAIRLIAGGPGSGKSTFAKAFASEQGERNTHQVLFVSLQRLRLSGSLRQSLAHNLTNGFSYKTPHMSELFPEDPLEWIGNDHRRLLIVFDGLDELTANEHKDAELTSKFVGDVHRELMGLNRGGNAVRAIVLGRTLAIEAALKEASLPLTALINVAPITPMDVDDLRLGNTSLAPAQDRAELVSDPDDKLEDDDREIYWNKWCKANGRESNEVPQAITDNRMSGLNAEPLLLHLLISSKYCGKLWEKAAENHNLVYEDILSKVFQRNKDKGLDAYKDLNESHFFELMEVFGLAAFRGNGRTGDHDDFERLRKRYVPPKRERDQYSKLSGASLKNVALMVHSRRDIEGAGFEFVHKSFGEYLAARALIGAAHRLRRRRNSDDFEEGDSGLALRWIDLIGQGVLRDDTLHFLRREAKQQTVGDLETTIEALSHILDRAIEEGFPAHLSADINKPTYRALEEIQACAEASMLAVLTNMWGARSIQNTTDSKSMQVAALKASIFVVSDLVARSFSRGRSSLLGAIPPQLSGLNLTSVSLRNSSLRKGNLSRADLRNANLSRANLIKTDLSGANMSLATLTSADLFAANLSGARLFRAEFFGASLFEADLSEAILVEAHLFEAGMAVADLKRADLTRADLTKADLSRADLKGALLRGVDFSKCRMDGALLRSNDLTACAGLTQEMINTCFGVKQGIGKVLLPLGLAEPCHWYSSEVSENAEDCTEYIQDYLKAYGAWRDGRLGA